MTGEGGEPWAPLGEPVGAVVVCWGVWQAQAAARPPPRVAPTVGPRRQAGEHPSVTMLAGQPK